MKNVRVLLTPGKKIMVFGLAAKVNGILGQNDEWLLAQTQNYGVKEVSEKEYEEISGTKKTWNVGGRYFTVDDDARDFEGTRALDNTHLDERKTKWAKKLTDELEAGCNMKGIDIYVLAMAQKLVSSLLRPTGMDIEFSEMSLQEVDRLGYGQNIRKLEEFARDFNRDRLLQEQ